MGVKELVLIAEDTTYWGQDLYGKPSLPLLLKELSKLDVMWIRVMYVFPPWVDDEFIATIKNTPNIANYIDMPIQHVNSTLLEAMNRKHDKSYLEGIIKEMHAEIPDLSLRTTFINGFPGETDDMVEEICDFIEQYPFSQLGCFTYSKERETRSARMAEQVPLDIAKKRLDRIMTHQYNLLQKRMPTLIGNKVQAIYEGNQRFRSFREAPEVDSVIISEKPCEHLKEGDLVHVTLSGISGYDFLV